jgi:hypothetical protein
MLINFRWAFAGALTSQSVAEPFDVVENVTTAAAQAFLISTPLGRRIVMASAGYAGSLLGYAAGTTAVGVTAGAAAGLVIGAAVGTAVSSVAFGPEGKQLAIDFYTGQNTRPIDYLPHYNAYKIVKHYATS